MALGMVTPLDTWTRSAHRWCFAGHTCYYCYCNVTALSRLRYKLLGFRVISQLNRPSLHAAVTYVRDGMGRDCLDMFGTICFEDGTINEARRTWLDGMGRDSGCEASRRDGLDGKGQSILASLRDETVNKTFHSGTGQQTFFTTGQDGVYTFS